MKKILIVLCLILTLPISASYAQESNCESGNCKPPVDSEVLILDSEEITDETVTSVYTNGVIITKYKNENYATIRVPAELVDAEVPTSQAVAKGPITIGIAKLVAKWVGAAFMGWVCENVIDYVTGHDICTLAVNAVLDSLSQHDELEATLIGTYVKDPNCTPPNSYQCRPYWDYVVRYTY